MALKTSDTLTEARFLYSEAVMKFVEVCEAIAPTSDGPLTDRQVAFIREVAPTYIYTQAELAKKFKVSKSYISEIINGKKKKVREYVEAR
jgi:predicted transcriptional regulator